MRVWHRIKNLWMEPLVRLVFFFTLFLFILLFVFYFSEFRVNRGNFSNIWDALWWFVVTITTTGYGDKIPLSAAGRLIATFTMFSGILFLSAVSGTVASSLVEKRSKEMRGMGRVSWKGHVAVLGWNYNAERLLELLPKIVGKDFNVVLVNKLAEDEMERIRTKFKDYIIKFIKGDYTQEETLERARIKDASTVFILADELEGLEEADERSVIACLSIKEINPKCKVYVEVFRPEKEVHVMRAGADATFVMGQFNAFLMAASMVAPAASEIARKLFSDKPLLRIEKMPASFVGKTYRELCEFIREKSGATVIGLLSIHPTISLQDILSEDTSAIDAFIKRKFQEAGSKALGKRQEVFTSVFSPPDNYKIGEKDVYVILIAPEGK